MSSEIKVLGHMLALWEGNFDLFQGEKHVFWSFESLFWSCMKESCLAIVWACKAQFLMYIQLERCINDLKKLKFEVKFRASERDILTIFTRHEAHHRRQ